MIVIMIVMVFVVLLGAFSLAYQVYRLTELDAQCRGFKHPKFWGLFSIGGNNSSGLFLYLIGRKKYPIHLSESDQAVMTSRKHKAGISLCFIAVGAIVLVLIGVFTEFSGVL